MQKRGDRRISLDDAIKSLIEESHSIKKQEHSLYTSAIMIMSRELSCYRIFTISNK